MCGGSTSVSYPGPTPAEQQLEQLQLQQLQQQSADMESFKPFVLQQYGLVSNPNYSQSKVDQFDNQINAWKTSSNPTGTGAPTDAQRQDAINQLEQAKADYLKQNPVYQYTPEQQARNQQLQQIQDQALRLQKAQGERQAQAIAGTLPLSAALVNQMGLDFQKLKTDQSNNGNEIIGDSLDNAVAKSTSGQQALEALRTTYGTLASNEQNAAINEAALPGVYGSQYTAATQPGAPNPSMFALNPQSYSSAYQPYIAQQQGQFQANATNASNNQSFYNTLLTGLLNGGSQAGGMAAAAMA